MPRYVLVCCVPLHCAQPLCHCEHTATAPLSHTCNKDRSERTGQRAPIMDVLPRRLIAIERIYNYQTTDSPNRAATEPMGQYGKRDGIRNSRSRDVGSGHFGSLQKGQDAGRNRNSRKYRELAPRAAPRCTRAPRMWSNTYGGESIVGAQTVHPDTRGGHDRAWAHTSVGDLDRVPSGSGVRSRHSAYSHAGSQGSGSSSSLARGSSNSLRYGGPLRFEGEFGGPYIRTT